MHCCACGQQQHVSKLLLSTVIHSKSPPPAPEISQQYLLFIFNAKWILEYLVPIWNRTSSKMIMKNKCDLKLNKLSFISAFYLIYLCSPLIAWSLYRWIYQHVYLKVDIGFSFCWMLSNVGSHCFIGIRSSSGLVFPLLTVLLMRSFFLCVCLFSVARQRTTPVLFSDQDSPGVYGKVRKAASTIDRFR